MSRDGLLNEDIYFVDSKKIKTFIAFLKRAGSISTNEVSVWFDKSNKITTHTINSINLLKDSNILTASGSNYLLSSSFLDCLEVQSIDNATKIFLLNSINESILSEFLKFSTYDAEGRLTWIVSGVPPTFISLRNLLVDFEIFEKVGGYLKASDLLSDYLKQIRNHQIYELDVKISQNELGSILERLKEYGDLAEKYVLKFEKKRLVDSKNIPKIISQYDVAAGYDIESYETKLSKTRDRFIEVKSYSGNKQYFHWSRNEIEAAKKIGNEYFLYLVNRDSLNKSGYEPEIIQNPIKNILENSYWKKEEDGYFITKDS